MTHTHPFRGHNPKDHTHKHTPFQGTFNSKDDTQIHPFRGYTTLKMTHTHTYPFREQSPKGDTQTHTLLYGTYNPKDIKMTHTPLVNTETLLGYPHL